MNRLLFRSITALMIGLGAGAIGDYAHSLLVTFGVGCIGLAFKWTIENAGDEE